nr:hypothetical protein [Paenibacillus hamazuiensis]
MELAISKLAENEIRDIYAVPLDTRSEEMKLMDTMHGTDGTSLVDLGLFMAMICGTIGVSRGYILEWGPIFWGLAGAVGGFAVGFAIDLAKNLIKRKKIVTKKSRQGSVILIVKCGAEQAKFVEQTLWEHRAIGLAKTRIHGSDDRKPPVPSRG